MRADIVFPGARQTSMGEPDGFPVLFSFLRRRLASRQVITCQTTTIPRAGRGKYPGGFTYPRA